MIYLDTYESPVGVLTLASNGPHMCGLWVDGQKCFEEKLETRLGVGKDFSTSAARLAGAAARAASPANAGSWSTRAWT